VSELQFDTIIIGGGPGGSTAGALLARAGQRVLILEKETFPRFHIGESLLPFGNAVLQESGAWEKVEAAGFMPKLGAEFVTRDQKLIFGVKRGAMLDCRAFQHLPDCVEVVVEHNVQQALLGCEYEIALLHEIIFR
jgi:2-polyprenyl-6-methoxyphenol hydroxylase-like FAD-dependent oxidoreductase